MPIRVKLFGDLLIRVFLSSSPVVAGGIIYNLDGRGNIYARKISDFGKSYGRLV